MGVARVLVAFISFVLLVIAPIYLISYSLFSSDCKWSFPDSRKIVLVGDPQMEGDTRVYHQGWYGQLNNDFNDWYFWLIMRNVHHLIHPDYIVILGDIFSSQYMDNEEFLNRLRRFNANFVPSLKSEHSAKMINLTGNHDIGYGDDLPEHRLRWFERFFGPQNIEYQVDDHVFVILNSMSLDGAYDKVCYSTNVLMKCRAYERNHGTI
jgi:hypothetical protein